MLTGSLASNLYGIARSTKDADIVLDASTEQLKNVFASIPEPLRVDPQMSFETVTATTRQIIELPSSAFSVELFSLSQDAHDRERFGRRREGTLLGAPVWVPTPEDVVIWKLRWSKQGRRSKDVDDARNVLAVQGNALDFDYIHRWCDEHGTRGLLDQIRESIPDDI
jgi:hypothetical protein